MTLLAPSGYGKSYAAEYFKARYRRETVLVKCSSDLQQSRALSEVSRQLGVRTSTDGVLQRRHIQEGIERLTRLGGKPLLIFDEAENIRPQTAGRIKALYDQLRRHDQGALCGFALMGTPDLVEYWEKVSGKQSPGAIQFSRRLLRWNTFVVPEKLDHESFFEAHGIADQKLRQALRQEEEYGAVVSIHRALVHYAGKLENTRFVRALQAVIRRQKLHRPMSTAVHSSITKPQIRKVWAHIAAGERRQCAGTQGAFRVVFYTGADEKPAYDARARGGADD